MEKDRVLPFFVKALPLTASFQRTGPDASILPRLLSSGTAMNSICLTLSFISASTLPPGDDETAVGRVPSRGRKAYALPFSRNITIPLFSSFSCAFIGAQNEHTAEGGAAEYKFAPSTLEAFVHLTLHISLECLTTYLYDVPAIGDRSWQKYIRPIAMKHSAAVVYAMRGVIFTLIFPSL